MKDPLIRQLQELTKEMRLMAIEQRETNRLVRELLELEQSDGGADDQAQPEGEAESLGTTVGRIIRRG